ncbi:unnamed protein product [Trifolium pratense]|uniref:Uncharacterized protein n=1 Tax=Trifolium pratense TaxID=57577 RepID=A0ACB0LQK9_TRIPR|nr:unnamed protein product [Trifolium pratense]
MAEILKFVYAMILFLSLFTDASNKYKFGRIPRVYPRIRECEHDDDCPQIVSSMVMRCNNYNCVAINHEDI